jgi:hypothetical protein
MDNNEILDQLHTIRKQIAKECNYDLRKLFTKYKTQQEQHPEQYYYGYQKRRPETFRVSEAKKEG